jgi:uncharacterized membrane protein YedE/YeeE
MYILISSILVVIMGVFVKLGNTCMFASTEQWINHKNPSKFFEIINSWFWVILLITSLQLTIGFNVLIQSFALSWMTFLGGLLLGLGAYMNKACAVGTISRIGDGNSNYLFTPIGMLISIFVFYHLPVSRPQQITETSVVTLYPVSFFILSLVSIVFLLIYFSSKYKHLPISQKLLGAPTTVVSICFVLLLLINTPWSYTEVISDFALNNFMNEKENLFLFFIFFLAVIIAGFYMGSFKPTRINFKAVITCFFGGVLIGWGSQLIIGSHDSITLYGFPLLLTSSVIAMLINLITIAACIKFIG